MRHKVTALIASQDPVNTTIIELSSSVIYTVPTPQLVTVRPEVSAAAAENISGCHSSLAPGESFVWANKATDSFAVKRR